MRILAVKWGIFDRFGAFSDYIVAFCRDIAGLFGGNELRMNGENIIEKGKKA